MKTDWTYDVAISFAGEDRACAYALADALKRRGLHCFYDRDKTAQLAGQNLYTHLADIYQNQARHCVMFLSRHYAQNRWTKLEREAAQARAFHEPQPYIVPVRLDHTDIPGILPTTGYLEWPPENADSIADVILALRGLASHPFTSLSLKTRDKIKELVQARDLSTMDKAMGVGLTAAVDLAKTSGELLDQRMAILKRMDERIARRDKAIQTGDARLMDIVNKDNEKEAERDRRELERIEKAEENTRKANELILSEMRALNETSAAVIRKLWGGKAEG